MNSFFSKLFGKPIFIPPFQVQEKLNKSFDTTLNVEWNKSGDFFEAIFYKNEREHIALFNQQGELLEYKMFLPREYLPEQINKNLSKKGEIMNSVMINKGNAVSYEIILRNEEKKRFLYLLNETGTILEKRKL